MAGNAAKGAREELQLAGRSSRRNGREQKENKKMNNMTLKTEGDKYVIVTRRFATSPEAVYRAHTDPKLVQQWMFGPEGGRCLHQ